MSVITLSDVKSHLRLTSMNIVDDVLLKGHIGSAESYIEQEYGLVANQRESVFTFDRFPRSLTIPARPAIADSVIVSYVDTAGEDQVLADCRAIMVDGWLRVLPPAGGAFPAIACEPGAVRISAMVGFATELTIDRCAGALRAALLMVVEALYRGWDGASEIPAVTLLLDGSRLRRV